MRVLKVLCCAAILTAMLAPGARADEYDKKTILTFSGAVQIPGKTLPAGTYVFKLADTSDRHIVRVFDKSEKQLIATLMAVPNQRMDATDKPVVMFSERPAGSPQAIKVWYYPGEHIGNEFIYPKRQAMRIAKETHQRVLSNNSEMTTADSSMATASVGYFDENGNWQTTGEQVATTGAAAPATTDRVAENTTSAPSPEPMVRSRKHLPRTASNLSLFELIAGLSLAGGLMLPVVPDAVLDGAVTALITRRGCRVNTVTHVGLAGLVGALIALPALSAPASQEPSFRGASSELVVLPVLVTDKQGAFVADVARERFAVFDNGRPVAIDVFTNQDAPATIGLIIDASASMRAPDGRRPDGDGRIRGSRAMRSDELFALRFNDDVRDALPDRRLLLADDVEGAQRRDRCPEAGRPDSAVRRRACRTRSPRVGIPRTQGAHRDQRWRRQRERGHARKGIVRARAANAAIYTIGVFEPDDDDRNPGVLKSLAEATGGERVPAAVASATCGRGVRPHRSRHTHRLQHRLRAAGRGRRVSPRARRHSAGRAKSHASHPARLRRGQGAAAPMTRESVRWIERGLIAPGIGLGLWCAFVVIEGQASSAG